MRLGLKTILLLVGGYAVLVAGFGLAIDRWLREFEEQGAMQTVRLIASENAAQISERALGALQDPDETSRRLLRSRLEDIVMFSEVVSSLTVVDTGGRVVASDLWAAGEVLPDPRELFGDDVTVRVRTDRAGLLDGGSFRVDVPVLQWGRLVGYVEVGLFNEEISHLYSRARRQLLLGALLGLVGVVVLGVALQLQINRRAATISRTLEEAIGPGGDREPRMDELTRALEAAGRARQVILDARGDQSHVGDGFKALAQVSKVGVVKIGPRSELTFANRRALELLGYSSLDELREGWRSAGPVLAPLDSQPSLVDLPGRGRSRRLRVETYCLGGAERGEMLALLVDPDVLDTLETDVRLASRLEGLARAYRTLAHEVRAPLSAMMINLDLLRESLVSVAPPVPNGGTDKGPERHAAVLRQELLRLNRTLSEVLTRTLPDRKAHRFDLGDALRELETLLGAQARRQGVDLVMTLPEERVVLVGLRDRLKQAFLNVAVNALEAVPSGGRIEVRMTPGKDRVSVSFCDDGPGIPAAILARIYERDFTTKGDGSGIGLYVARSLVELHGGSIRVDSEAGRGTTVVVDLPVVPQR